MSHLKVLYISGPFFRLKKMATRKHSNWWLLSMKIYIWIPWNYHHLIHQRLVHQKVSFKYCLQFLRSTVKSEERSIQFAIQSGAIKCHRRMNQWNKAYKQMISMTYNLMKRSYDLMEWRLWSSSIFFNRMPLQSFLVQRLTRIFFPCYCPNYISSTSVCIYLHRLDLKRTCFLTFTLFVMLIKCTNVSGLPITKIRIFN